MKTTVSILVLLFAVNLVFAQDKPKNQSPDEQIKVKRKYDDHGNLIGYDSTYVKTWADTTKDGMGMGKMREEVKTYFGNQMPGEMADSTMMGQDPFGDLHKFFSQSDRDFFNHFNPSLNDSSLVMPQDSMMGMDDFEQLRAEMMDHFRHFFNDQNDSTQIHIKGSPDQSGFDSFFNDRGFEQMRKEMEKHFKQFPPNSSGNAQKMKMSSEDKNNPTVEL